MSEQKNLEQAKVTFDTLCRALEKQEWDYKKYEDKFVIECGAQGADLPMKITVEVNPKNLLVILLSRLPFVIQEDKRLDVAVAVSAINNALVDGCFDYDISTGNIYFRMSNSFIDSKIGEEVFIYMLICSCQTIDEYNDKILMLAKGMLSIEQLVSKILY